MTHITPDFVVTGDISSDTIPVILDPLTKLNSTSAADSFLIKTGHIGQEYAAWSGEAPYFGTGDAATIQTAALIQPVSGDAVNWVNTDFRPGTVGGTNPAYAGEFTAQLLVDLAKFRADIDRITSRNPSAVTILLEKNTDTTPVEVFNGVADTWSSALVTNDEGDLSWAATVIKETCRGTRCRTSTRTYAVSHSSVAAKIFTSQYLSGRPNTQFYTVEKSVVNAINEIIQDPEFAVKGIANFRYTSGQLNTIITAFDSAVGQFIAGGNDFAEMVNYIYKLDRKNIDYKDFAVSGSIISGMKLIFRDHFLFTRRPHVWQSGYQDITGFKDFKSGAAVTGDFRVSNSINLGSGNVLTGSTYSLMVGSDNSIANSDSSVIFGVGNEIVGNAFTSYPVTTADQTVFLGAADVGSAATHNSILGGTGNIIFLAENATVVGGAENTAGEDFTLAAGRKSKAYHSGSFVLSDSEYYDKPSIDTDTISLYFRQGVYVPTGHIYIKKEGEFQPVATLGENDFSGHANFFTGITVSGDTTLYGAVNLSGVLNVTGNAYISGELWITGADGEPCQVTCAGGGGGSFSCSDLNTCSVADLADGSITGSFLTTGTGQFDGDTILTNKTISLISVPPGEGTINISGTTTISGDTYISGELWITGADGSPCKVACSGDLAADFKWECKDNWDCSIFGNPEGVTGYAVGEPAITLGADNVLINAFAVNGIAPKITGTKANQSIIINSPASTILSSIDRSMFSPSEVNVRGAMILNSYGSHLRPMGNMTSAESPHSIISCKGGILTGFIDEPGGSFNSMYSSENSSMHYSWGTNVMIGTTDSTIIGEPGATEDDYDEFWKGSIIIGGTNVSLGRKWNNSGASAFICPTDSARPPSGECMFIASKSGVFISGGPAWGGLYVGSGKYWKPVLGAGGGGGSFSCSDLNTCSVADLADGGLTGDFVTCETVKNCNILSTVPLGATYTLDNKYCGKAPLGNAILMGSDKTAAGITYQDPPVNFISPELGSGANFLLGASSLEGSWGSVYISGDVSTSDTQVLNSSIIGGLGANWITSSTSLTTSVSPKSVMGVMIVNSTESRIQALGSHQGNYAPPNLILNSYLTEITGQGEGEHGADPELPNTILGSIETYLYSEDGSTVIGAKDVVIARPEQLGASNRAIVMGGKKCRIGSLTKADEANKRGQYSVSILGGLTQSYAGPPGTGAIFLASQNDSNEPGAGIYVSGALYITGTDGKWCQITGCGGGGGGGGSFSCSDLNTCSVADLADGSITGSFVTSTASSPNPTITLISNTDITLEGDVTISGDMSLTGSLTIGSGLHVSGCLTSYACITDSTSTSLTMDDTYLGKIIHLTPASSATITLPSTFNGLKDGWQTTVMNMSTQSIEFAAGGGTNLYSLGTKLTGQYQAATVYYNDANWYAAGALS